MMENRVYCNIWDELCIERNWKKIIWNRKPILILSVKDNC